MFCEQHLKMMARYGQLSGLAASGVGSVPETHSPLFPRDLLSSPAQMGYRSPLVRGKIEQYTSTSLTNTEKHTKEKSVVAGSLVGNCFVRFKGKRMKREQFNLWASVCILGG